MSFPYTVIDIIDAIATDLAPLAQKAAQLGPGSSGGDFLDWRYSAPDMLNAENAPWLAVYSTNVQHTLISTVDQYQDEDDIEIEWAIPIGSETELGGAGMAAVIKAALVAAAPILERLRTYASGLPSPFDNEVVGTLSSTSRETDRGLVWRQTSRLIANSMGAE